MSEKFPAGSRRDRAPGRGRHEQPAGAAPAARPGLPRGRAPRIQLPGPGRHPAPPPDAAPAGRHRRLALTGPQELLPHPPRGQADGRRALQGRRPRPPAAGNSPARAAAPRSRPARRAAPAPRRGQLPARPRIRPPHRRATKRGTPSTSPDNPKPGQRAGPGIVFRAGENAVLDVAAPAPGGAIDPLDADGPGKQARGRTTTS